MPGRSWVEADPDAPTSDVERSRAADELDRLAERHPTLARVADELGPTEGLTDDEAADLMARLHDERRRVHQGIIGDSTAGQLLRLLERRLRETGNTSLAELVHAQRTSQQYDYAALSEDNKARLDALVYGVGYLHDGKRLDPSTVRIIRPPAYQRDQ